MRISDWSSDVCSSDLMDAQTLKTELAAASYREDGGKRTGTYSHEGPEWVIASRGFRDVGGDVAPSRVEVTLSGGRVASLRDAGSGKKAKSVRLDPARIATLYGQAQEERQLVRIEDVPELLVTGLQAVEDRDFAHHHGIDLSGMLRAAWVNLRSEEHTSELQSLMRISYAVFCLKKKTNTTNHNIPKTHIQNYN